MGISHLLFPEMYKAVYKLSRGDLLPKTLESQINAQNQILNELNIVLPFVKYSTENNINKSAAINFFTSENECLLISQNR